MPHCTAGGQRRAAGGGAADALQGGQVEAVGESGALEASTPDEQWLEHGRARWGGAPARGLAPIPRYGIFASMRFWVSRRRLSASPILINALPI